MTASGSDMPLPTVSQHDLTPRPQTARGRGRRTNNDETTMG